MSARPTFFIRTLGCKVNRAESEKIAAALIGEGWCAAQSAACDLAVLNTCTVTAEADAKCRKALRSLLRENPARVIVTGCAVRVSPDVWRDIDGRITVLPSPASVLEASRELSQAIASEARPVEGESSKAASADADANEAAGASQRPLFRTRADVKIQDGCDRACSYCIVHVARGPARSVPADDVVREVGRLAESGTREVVLVGIDISAWRDEQNGISATGWGGAAGAGGAAGFGDEQNGISATGWGGAAGERGAAGWGGATGFSGGLASLCGRLLCETSIARIRLSSLEPEGVTPELLDVIASSEGRICRHLHICLQSGSEKVLAEMNRGYTPAEFEEIVRAARERIPKLALSTDVIVGFPGETEDDFLATAELVRRCAFMRLHIFCYSRRDGTPAAERDDQVPPEVASERAARLRAIASELAARDALSRVGDEETIVVERAGRGTSESYHTVVFDPRGDDAPRVGEIAHMRLERWDGEKGAFVGGELPHMGQKSRFVRLDPQD